MRPATHNFLSRLSPATFRTGPTAAATTTTNTTTPHLRCQPPLITFAPPFNLHTSLALPAPPSCNNFSSSFPQLARERFHLRQYHTTTTVPDASMSATKETVLDPIEAAKREAAYQAVKDHFTSDMQFVGIGSGSTIVYGVEAISAHLKANPPPQGQLNWFVPTGWNSRKVIEQAGLIPIAFDSLPADRQLDVCFDGADEVDEELNCIKGGGACLFQEKLVAERSKKFICIADYRKNQKRLLTNWPYIPIEVAPIAHASVITNLKLLGSVNPKLREHSLAKTGPVQTDQSFYIIDAPFPTQLLTSHDLRVKGLKGDGTEKDDKGNKLWGIVQLALAIRGITGVLEVGLFQETNGYEAQKIGKTGGQKPVAVYFGMADGSVSSKTAEDVEKELSSS